MLNKANFITNWPTKNPKWTDIYINLLTDGAYNPIPKQTVIEIAKKSRDFAIKFPILSTISQNLCKSVKIDVLERNINSVYPIIHEHSLYLCTSFLMYKREYGSEKEKELYKNKTVKDLIERLLTKRAVMFMGRSDTYLLLDRTQGINNWKIIGTANEKPPLILENYLSYDEIKLSALLSVSSYSHFINDGNRHNHGIIPDTTSDLQREGIIIGLIGTRLELENVMEFQEIIISRRQNFIETGYGVSDQPSLHRTIAEFYEEIPFTYDDDRIRSNASRFVKLENHMYFDNVAYAKRLSLSFDLLLIEANFRAKQKNCFAYIHMVGIGLGVWKISNHQEKVFVKTFAERIKFFGNQLSNISDIHFAYFSKTEDCDGYKNGEIFPISEHPNEGIKIHISKREPFKKLSESDKLLVVAYAWDGNALPGNEYWIGMLGSTGDSAAACSTQITEIHNPHINKLVSAENLMIATLNNSVVPFQQYCQMLKETVQT